MIVARVTGLVLFAVAIICGSALLVLPLSEASDADLSEEYSMFTKEYEYDFMAHGVSLKYTHDSLDVTGGITYLRAMGPALVTGLIFLVAAFIVTGIPKTSPSAWGGLIAVPGAVLLTGAVVFATLGPLMQADERIGLNRAYFFNDSAVALAITALLASLIAAGMGMVRMTSGEHYVAGRELACPKCATRVYASLGTVPVCPKCEFGSEYTGPGSARSILID